MSSTAEIERAGERLVVMAERALWWPAGDTVFVADTHFGKDSTFRAASIPIPTGTTDGDLGRLDRVLTVTKAGRMVVLGDFFHARSGRSEALAARLDAWRAEHAELELVVVRGNHDLHAGDVPEAWEARTVDGPWPDGPFLLMHDEAERRPSDGVSAYALSGHLHPGVRLRGRGDQSLALPCFHFGASGAVLPAFGSFTGLHLVKPVRQDELFVLADGDVIRVA